MTLVERCERLVRQIEWSSKLDAMTHAAKQIGERTDRMDIARRRIGAAFDRAMALREAGIALAWPACQNAIELCRRAAARVRGTADSVKQDAAMEDAAWRRLTKAIEQDANSLDATVKVGIDAAWKTVSDLQLSALQAIALAARREVFFQELMDCQRLLLGTSWHTKPALELRQILEWRSSLMKGASTITDIGAPEDVRLFLDLARKGEAAVDGLTPSIRRWLEEKGLLGNLRITLGAR